MSTVSSPSRRTRKPSPGEIPVGAFQRRYRYLLSRGITAKQIALNLGWVESRSPRRRPDAQRFLRTIGLIPFHNNDKEIRWKKTIKPETAKKIAEAMYCDPVDLGF